MTLQAVVGALALLPPPHYTCLIVMCIRIWSAK